MSAGFAVTSIIIGAQVHFADLSNQIALGYLNDINTNLQQYMRLNPETQIQIQLTNGVATYPYPSDVYLIKEANYAFNSSPQSPIKLWFTNTDFLDKRFPSWRWSSSPGQPVYCYVDSSMVGFWPVPNESTVGIGTTALPIVNLFVTQINSVPFQLTDYIPAIVPSPQIFTYGICKLWAGAYHPSKFAYFNDLYTQEVRRVSDQINNIEIRDKQTIMFQMPTISRI